MGGGGLSDALGDENYRVMFRVVSISRTKGWS